MLLSIVLGTVLQYLALKLGVVTGLSLGQLTRENYARPVTALLWALTEVGIVCSDIPQVLGSAFALKLLLRVPLYIGVFISLLTVVCLVFTDVWESRFLRFWGLSMRLKFSRNAKFYLYVCILKNKQYLVKT